MVGTIEVRRDAGRLGAALAQNRSQRVVAYALVHDLGEGTVRHYAAPARRRDHLVHLQADLRVPAQDADLLALARLQVERVAVYPVVHRIDEHALAVPDAEAAGSLLPQYGIRVGGRQCAN